MTDADCRPPSDEIAQVTVLILARNEAKNIEECIKSARLLTDKVIVVDMESADGTATIARSLGAKVVRSPLIREFDKGREIGAREAETEWVFFLDADERLTEIMAAAIRQVLSNPEYDAYGFPFHHYFLNRRLQGLYPYKGVQLVKKGAFAFGGVHVPAQVDGQIALVECEGHGILHYSTPTLSRYLAKLDLYTDLEADKVLEQNPGWEVDFREMEQSFFYAWHKVWQQTWRDGMDGWIYSMLSAVYEFVSLAKAYERAQRRSFMAPPVHRGKHDALLREKLVALFGSDILFSDAGRHKAVCCRGAPLRFDFSDSTEKSVDRKVLMVAHSHASDMFGGGEVQMFETMRELAKIGVFADCSVGFVERGDYDLYHFFGLAHQAAVYEATDRRKPIVCSTIYWDHTMFASVFPEFSGGKTYAEWDSAAPELLERAVLLFPNSAAEVGRLPAEYAEKCRVVPNAVRPPAGVVDAKTSGRSMAPYVLCVGRAEKKKNPERLIEAVLGIEEDPKPNLVFIGDRQGKQPPSNERVFYLDALPREELWDWYRGALCHALPSFYETPGLVTMEALSVGCPCVCGNMGAEQEYFGDDVEYCDPTSAESIRSAILRAMDRPRRVVQMPSWGEVAEKTARLYEEAIARYAGMELL